MAADIYFWLEVFSHNKTYIGHLPIGHVITKNVEWEVCKKHSIGPFFLRIRTKLKAKLNWMTEKISILVYCATRVCLTFALWRVCIVRVWLWNTVSMCILASSTAAENFPFTFPKQNQTFTLNFKTFQQNWDNKAPSVGTLLAYLETTA